MPINLEPLPKSNGTCLTATIDTGMGTSRFRDMVELNVEHLNYVKFGWGSAVVTPNLEEKLQILRTHGIGYWFGGTLFEIAFRQQRLDDLKKWVEAKKAAIFEVSDGTIELPEDRKCELIQELSSSFRVVSEVGSKDVTHVMNPSEWIRRINQEKKAGAWKIITEGRESGTVGVYRSNGEVREGLIDDMIERGIAVEDLVFEAPRRAQQIWFLKRFGRLVNLSNIPSEDVFNLYTMRLGLRGDTIEFSTRVQ